MNIIPNFISIDNETIMELNWGRYDIWYQVICHSQIQIKGQCLALHKNYWTNQFKACSSTQSEDTEDSEEKSEDTACLQ